MQLKQFELFRHPYSYCSLCKPLGNPPSARTVSLLQLLSFMLGFRHCCLLLKHSSFTALISIKCFVSFDLPAAPSILSSHVFPFTPDFPLIYSTWCTFSKPKSQQRAQLCVFSFQGKSSSLCFFFKLLVHVFISVLICEALNIIVCWLCVYSSEAGKLNEGL